MDHMDIVEELEEGATLKAVKAFSKILAVVGVWQGLLPITAIWNREACKNTGNILSMLLLVNKAASGSNEREKSLKGDCG